MAANRTRYAQSLLKDLARIRKAPDEDLDQTALAEDISFALITTAAPFNPELGDQGPGASYNAAAKFFRVYTENVDPPPNLRISHLGYDRDHSTAEDPNTWLPVARLQEAVAGGRLGELAPRLVGVPTNRSQRVTAEQDAPAALAACRRIEADVTLLVPT